MRKAIAIDFDGCLCSDAYPNIGIPNWEVISRANSEQKDGAGLILWTCREGQLLQEAVSACKTWGLVFDAINESLPEWSARSGTAPRKIGATEYWDDRAVRLPVISAQWISMGRKMKCSGCNGVVYLGTGDLGIHEEEKELFRYCPTCGARMCEGFPDTP